MVEISGKARKVRVKVPATTANLGPGFDTLGMALSLYNYIELEETADNQRLSIDVQGEGADTLPRDENNEVWRAASQLFDLCGYRPSGINLRLFSQIPVARGLGSSAAARVGGLVAANALLGGKLPGEELLAIASRLEGHPDNVAAAMHGGIIVAGVAGERVVWRKIDIPSQLEAVVAVPEFELSTAQACSVLPCQVPFRDAVFNLERACLLAVSLIQNDLEAVGELMEDRLHQPYREMLIPGLKDVFKAAREAGALGAALSGAGPAVLALARGNREAIGQAMQQTLLVHGINCTVRYLRPVNRGVEVSLL